MDVVQPDLIQSQHISSPASQKLFFFLLSHIRKHPCQAFQVIEQSLVLHPASDQQHLLFFLKAGKYLFQQRLDFLDLGRVLAVHGHVGAANREEVGVP